MNKQAFLDLADVIENAPSEQFHMGSWFGELVEYDPIYASTEEHEDEISFYVEEGELVPDSISMFDALKESTTADSGESLKLKCNTTACIAGWAVANAWYQGNSIYSKDQLENIGMMDVINYATDILDLNGDEVQNLFYCDRSSVWSRVAYEYGLEFHPEFSITWKIHPKHVADVLRRIAHGELTLENFEEDDES